MDDADAARDCAFRALEIFAAGEVIRVAAVVDELGAELPARDRALARELALGVLRWQRLYDALADRFLRPGTQPDPLRWALRLTAHQLFALDRVPPHAAGHSGVELLRRHGHVRLTGVANAVIRRLSQLRLAERREAPGPQGRLAPQDLPSEPALRWSLPDELFAALAPALPAESEAVLAALNEVPPLCTRDRGAVAASAADDPAVLRREGPWTWWARSEVALRGPVAAGSAVVQDRAQGCILELVAELTPGRACDCCAAPGGKSSWLQDRGWRVIAADAAPAKMPGLRAILGAAGVLAQDGRRPALLPGFDLVVVDAPCSNSGVLARRPEARWRFSASELASLNRLQEQLLRAGLGLLRPGGRLLYATCSLMPAENGELVRRVGAEIVAERTVLPDRWQMGGYGALLAPL